MYEILIIGSGPAGLTSAIYAARANKKVAIITGVQIGGQLMKTTDVENYPGFVNPILGPDLMNNMIEQAKKLNVEMVEENVIAIEKIEDVFYIKTQNYELKANSIIVATGSTPKMLGIEGNLLGYGISTCATCDGNFFRNKIVAVVGGGNSALEESLYLSNIAKTVYLIHRRNQFRGEEILKSRVDKKENIEILTPYKVNSFVGEPLLQGIIIENIENHEKKEISLNGAFIAIGHTPNSEILKNLLELDEFGYIKDGPITKVPGLYVAGDVFDSQYRQAITSAGFGCMAAIEAIKYLNN